MDLRASDIFGDLAASGSRPAAWAIARQLADAAGADWITCASVPEDETAGDNFPEFLTTSPPEWRQIYRENRLDRADPARILMRAGADRPYFFGDDLPGMPWNPGFQRLVDHSGEFGMGGAVMFPVLERRDGMKFGALIGSRRPPAEFYPHIESILPQLHLALSLVVHSLSDHWQPFALRVALSLRERECLQWCAAGKTSAETGAILSISEVTVNWHLKNAARKLDAVNRTHAVAKAVNLGLVEVI
jgi:DNA-binding CsgD family transcriptional regulator